jgi:hypothetical protein
VKHITFGDKSLLVGDAVADALLKYGAFLTTANRGDTVEIHAISSDGDETVATFLLGPGVTMMAETAHNNLPEPDNTAAVKYMEQAQSRAVVLAEVVPDGEPRSTDYDDVYGLDPQRSW